MEEAESVCPAVHHLVEPLLNPQLTNQQFINCAFLERPPYLVRSAPFRTVLCLPISVSLSRKTRDLLVGVLTVPYCKHGER